MCFEGLIMSLMTVTLVTFILMASNWRLVQSTQGSLLQKIIRVRRQTNNSQITNTLVIELKRSLREITNELDRNPNSCMAEDVTAVNINTSDIEWHLNFGLKLYNDSFVHCFDKTNVSLQKNFILHLVEFISRYAQITGPTLRSHPTNRTIILETINQSDAFDYLFEVINETVKTLHWRDEHSRKRQISPIQLTTYF